MQAMEGIAIVGMAGRFPGAPDLATYWRNLEQGIDSIGRFPPAELEMTSGGGPDDPDVVGARGVLEGIEDFDARFFGFLPAEAEVMDPQQRIFLELAWQAIEHAGYDAQRFDGPIGVFGGCFMNTYLLANLCSRAEFLAELVASAQTEAIMVELGNEKDHLATHAAFRLGLRGPAMTIQAACATSLVATTAACQSLLLRECDMALAGGATIVVPQRRGYVPGEGSILSADGTCRPFDAAASGTVFSNGAGVLLLRRLDDAIAAGDTIYAVIRGWAVNNDGNRKVNYTAPSAAGQAEVVGRALAAAQVDARTIGYVEAHGTATPVGDPIEVAGLTTAYARHTADTGFCALGSVKANIGHLDVASGVASLIKVALALHKGVIPPLAHYRAPNPKIDLAVSPFYINTSAQPWPAGATPRRAAISGFGLGGTNAHLILEQAPPLVRSQSTARAHELFLLSARTESALASACEQLAAHLEAEPDQALADVAFTLQAGRRQFDHRRFIVAGDRADLVAKLRTPAPRVQAGNVAALDPPLMFVFPGQGSQYPGMARELYQEQPVFRATIDACAQALADDPEVRFALLEYLLWEPKHGRPIAEVSAEMSHTDIAQPTIFALEIALGRLLLAAGLRPAALVGHSLGEFAAACLAGVFSLEDAMRLVALRGRLMQAQVGGAMLAVRMRAEDLAAMLPAELVISAVNAPEACVVSGPPAAIEALAARIEADGGQAWRLAVSHAFHASSMAPAQAPLQDAVARLERRAPALPFWSTVSASLLAGDELCDPAYWGRQLMDPVRFHDTVVEVASRGRWVVLEVGPRAQLSAFCQASLPPGRRLATLNCLGNDATGSQSLAFWHMFGRLWLAGTRVDWRSLHAGRQPRRLALPGYPFERRRFWIERAQPAGAPAARPAASAQPVAAPVVMPGTAVAAPAAIAANTASAAPAAAPPGDGSPAPSDSERLLIEIWSGLLGLDDIAADDNFFDLGGHSLLVARAIAEIRKRTGVRLSPNRFAFETLGQIAASLTTPVGTPPTAPATPVASSGAAAPVASPAAASAGRGFLQRLLGR